MKKHLIWIPIIGFFTTFYYQIVKGEYIVDTDNPSHFFGTAFYQAIWVVILLGLMKHYI